MKNNTNYMFYFSLQSFTIVFDFYQLIKIIVYLRKIIIIIIYTSHRVRVFFL